MATWQYQLADPPTEPRARELWLQHAAGFIIFEDVRRYAMDRIDPVLAHEAREAAQRGIDDAVYALMMVIDGVSGGLSNPSHTASIDVIARLTERGDSTSGDIQLEVALRDGDGIRRE